MSEVTDPATDAPAEGDVAQAATATAAPAHDDHGGHDAHATSTGLSNTKLAMWLFLGSECLLFGGVTAGRCSLTG